MKRSLSKWLVALLSLAALEGCGQLVNGQTLVLTRPDLVDITVTNSLQAPVCRVWMTPINSEDWGLDWLAGGEPVAVGAQRALRVPRGHWDLRIGGCGQNAATLGELQNLAVDETHNAISLGQPPAPARRPYVPANATPPAPSTEATPPATPAATAAPAP